MYNLLDLIMRLDRSYWIQGGILLLPGGVCPATFGRTGSWYCGTACCSDLTIGWLKKTTTHKALFKVRPSWSLYLDLWTIWFFHRDYGNKGYLENLNPAGFWNNQSHYTSRQEWKAYHKQTNRANPVWDAFIYRTCTVSPRAEHRKQTEWRASF